MLKDGSNGPHIEMWAVDRVQPYEGNPRSIPDKAIKKVAGSLKKFGFQKPIVVDEHGVIIAGHVLLKAAIAAGFTRVPVAISNLPPAEARAYRIADNRTAQETDWIDELLKTELTALDDLDFDLDSLGFDDRELQKLLSDDAELERAEETPEAPVNSVTIEGDVWVLDKHRIICGSSTDADTVAKVLNGVEPHLMVTDPPYGVSYDPTRTSNNKAKAGKVLNDDRADWSEAWALFPGDVAYVWHAPGPLQVSVYESLAGTGFEPRQHIIWAKDRFTLGRSNYQYQHEPCWYAVKSKAAGHWNGDRTQTSVWTIKAREDGGHGHGTQKPVECMRRPIVNNSSPGQAVYEPFSGSGTTIIAGEMTGRHVYAIELNPAYVDVAVKRWQTFSGKQATHAETGLTFDEMDTKRYNPKADAEASYTAGIDAMRAKLEVGKQQHVE